MKIMYEITTRREKKNKCRICRKGNLERTVKGREEEEVRRLINRHSKETDISNMEITIKTEITEEKMENEEINLPAEEEDYIDLILAQLNEKELTDLPELNEEDLAFLYDLLQKEAIGEDRIRTKENE